ncbi:MAG: hypothetical protein EA378_10435 [Phycisphaerales bacterium]|nr:MAG: hypothetical protein EA378_10435 [Phycisphaerales bacterium]
MTWDRDGLPRGREAGARCAARVGALLAAAAVSCGLATPPAFGNSPFPGDCVDITGGVPIGDLVGQCFVVDDKYFEIKLFQPTGQPGAGTDQVMVFPVNLGRRDGIGFDLVGNWSDPVGGGPSGFILEYHVTVLDFNWWMIANVLEFDGFASGGASAANVLETVSVDELLTIGQKEVFALASLPGSEWVLRDELQFDPELQLQTLVIRKEFTLFADIDGIAQASLIRQTFIQIPSPAGGLLLAMGGLAAARRRR